MKTLNYILEKYKLDSSKKSPIEITKIGRDEIASLFNELNFKVGAEVGVCDGTYSEILCKNNPGLKLYGIDPWEPYVGYRDYAKVSTFQKMIEDTKKKLSPYNFITVKKYSMDAVKDFEDNSLDFVYIDANHEDPYITDDIREWYKKVKIDGVLFGHDYANIRLDHQSGVKWAVKAAVNKFTLDNRISPWFTTGIDAPIIRKADTYRSWIIIK